MRRALENANRAPTPAQRFYIEGSYYTFWEESFDRGMEAFRKSLEQDPAHADSRSELAWGYWVLEEFDEALEHYEILLQRDRTMSPLFMTIDSWAGYSGGSAKILIALGRLQEAQSTVEMFLREYPDSAEGYRERAE